MNIKEFKAGQWLKQFEYESFSPARVNREWSWDDPKINTLLERATQALGEYRRSQNWIGGSGPSDAAFVPPVFHEIPGLMSDLEKFWHDETIYVPI